MDLNSIDPDSVIMIGGGGHAKICIDLIQGAKIFKIGGIIDSHLLPGEKILDIPVLGDDGILEFLRQQGVKKAVVSVGAVENPLHRMVIFHRLKSMGFHVPNIIHRSATVEPSVQMGKGNQIMAGAIVGSDVRLGNNCIVNYSTVVAHDCVLEDGVHLCPGVQLSGGVLVKQSAIIFTGAILFPGVKIGEEAVISAAAVVSHDVPPKTTVAGIPARRIGGMGFRDIHHS